VNITLSILKMLLLCFIILDLTGDHITTSSIHHIEFFLTFELIFILYYIKFSMINYFFFFFFFFILFFFSF